MSQTFRGLWPAMVTPLSADGKPNFAVMEQLVDLFVQQKLDGIYLTGSTGQWPLLTLEERTAIMDCVVKAAAGRIPVMAHIGAASTQDAVHLAQAAARSGANAVSAVAPIYYSHPESVVFAHYRAIGEATDLPFFAYHLSSAASTKIHPGRYAEQLLSIPHLVGMKYTDVDLYVFGLIQSAAHGRLQIFSGADEVLCQAVASGSVGAIGTFYNLWGPSCRQARQAMVDGNVTFATEFMLRLQTAISRVVERGSIWTFLQAALRLKYGLEIGMPRAPLGQADKPWEEAHVQEIIQLVDQA